MDIPGTVDRAFVEAIEAIRATPDALTAFTAASDLARIARARAGDVAELRSEMLGRLREERQENLTELASHLGVSKQRLQQLAAYRKRAAEGEPQ